MHICKCIGLFMQVRLFVNRLYPSPILWCVVDGRLWETYDITSLDGPSYGSKVTVLFTLVLNNMRAAVLQAL